MSRSYCHPYALVGWHTEPVGVDIERFVACPEKFAQSISTPAEYTPAGDGRPIASSISLWSSKEALAKALGDAADYDPRRLASPAGWPGGASGPWRTATLRARTATAHGSAGARRPPRDARPNRGSPRDGVSGLSGRAHADRRRFR